MQKCKITVWDYMNNMHLLLPILTKPPDGIPPIRYDVEAWCVGGDEGIRAFFFLDNRFCTADGDDGHWWLVSTCHKDWFKEIKEAINAVG